MPWEQETLKFPYTTFSFIVGAATSMLAGFIGMQIATQTNVKVTYLCNIDINQGFQVAFNGGQVLGFCLVGLALCILEIIILAYRPSVMGALDDNASQKDVQDQVRKLFEFVSGYGLGGSTVALFGRVGGGIYTKAADVGADLAGKVGEHLEEDSPLNPGTIADNVGDNVGDIAGMGADLFGSLAESTCAALVVSSTSWPLLSTPDAVYFPLIVTSVGIIASFICVQFACIKMSVEAKLRTQLILSSVLMSALLYPTLYMLPESLEITFNPKMPVYHTSQMQVYGCIMLGLWSGLLIGLSTEYYTSHSYGPTRELARACLYDAATNVIKGLALGYMSNVIPIICLAVTVLLTFHWAAMYGAIGMLGCLPVCLTIDGYGPISDNAGGIAEMCNLDKSVRVRTDALDAAGNTTAAVGKGFAIGSACLVALALFGAFVTRISDVDEDAYIVNILEPFTFSGLLLGAMLPYAFSALTMSAVGTAAEEMIVEIREQVPHIKAKEEGYPNHERCIAISTTASLKKMIAPGAIVIVSPLLMGLLFGYRAVSGLLAGTIVSGIQIAFSASNTGGAWDNAKKYVEAGLLMRPIDMQKEGVEAQVKKGDREHAAAVVGDTVGDPLKDTSGPSINILIKLSAITSLVFGGFIAKYGGIVAGKTASQ
jgi:H+-translocating diphosphatase